LALINTNVNVSIPQLLNSIRYKAVSPNAVILQSICDILDLKLLRYGVRCNK